MELISLKAACDAIYKEYDGYPYGERARGLNDAVGIILAEVPTIPAVPLDKLCEMLDKYNVTVPCNDDCEGCEAFDGTGDTVNCWKVTLAKWMEEQDESN